MPCRFKLLRSVDALCAKSAGIQKLPRPFSNLAATYWLLASVLGFLEEHFASGSEHVSELIAVSILETMPLKGEDGAELRELIGPAMRDHVERYLTW